MTDPPAAAVPAGPPAAADQARSFHLRVFGCQMNFYDGELIRAAFLRRGYRETASPEEARVLLFHTCSVRQHAEERVHGLLGELRRRKRRDPLLVVGVVGCMAEREGRELFEREPHVDLVCGSRRFPELPGLVERALKGEERVLAVGEAGGPVNAPVRDLLGRPTGHSAQLAVMRGCDLNCSFCIVPSVRGRVESRPVAEVVDECRRLADAGVTELRLLGQTVDAYGTDLGPRGGRPRLGRLLDELAAVEGLQRVGLITLHPAYCDAELADAMARSPQFMRLLPLPLQSGSDAVLRRMRRGYTLDLYRRRVDLLRERMPDLELVGDWIVGFPGETADDFAASETALQSIGFLRSYVFQYSPRPGTAAAAWADDVPAGVKRERNHRLLELQREVARRRGARMVGARTRLLLEGPDERHTGWWEGRTDNGHRALLPARPSLRPGQLHAVRLTAWTGRELLAAAAGSRRGAAPPLQRESAEPAAAVPAAPTAAFPV